MSEGINEPPTVRDVEVTREPPFVRVEERPERRREHLTMAGVFALATAAFLLVLPPLAALTGIGTGYALATYHAYPDRYDAEEVHAR